MDLLQTAHQNHELWLAQIRSGRQIGHLWVDGWSEAGGEEDEWMLKVMDDNWVNNIVHLLIDIYM